MEQQVQLTDKNDPQAILDFPNKVPIVNDGGGLASTLQKKVDDHQVEIDRLKEDLKNERQNLLTVFGIFASLVTFFTVEVQIFKTIDDFWILVGLSAFLVASMLLFVYSLHAIARDRLGPKEFFYNPIIITFFVFLIFAFFMFWIHDQEDGSRLEKAHPQPVCSSDFYIQ